MRNPLNKLPKWMQATAQQPTVGVMIAAGGGVSSINSATGAITLANGTLISIVQSPTGTFTFNVSTPIPVADLAAGSNGQVLETVGGVPTWSTFSGGGGIPTTTTWPVSGGAAGSYFSVTNCYPGRRTVEYIASGPFPVVINVGLGTAGAAGGAISAVWERPVQLGNLLMGFYGGLNSGAGGFTAGWTYLSGGAGPNTNPVIAYKTAGAGDVSSATATPFTGSTGPAGVICVEIANANQTPTSTGSTLQTPVATTANHLYMAFNAQYNNAFQQSAQVPWPTPFVSCGNLITANTTPSFFSMNAYAVPWIAATVLIPANVPYFASNSGPYGANNIGGMAVDVAPQASPATLDFWATIERQL